MLKKIKKERKIFMIILYLILIDLFVIFCGFILKYLGYRFIGNFIYSKNDLINLDFIKFNYKNVCKRKNIKFNKIDEKKFNKFWKIFKNKMKKW